MYRVFYAWVESEEETEVAFDTLDQAQNFLRANLFELADDGVDSADKYWAEYVDGLFDTGYAVLVEQ